MIEEVMLRALLLLGLLHLTACLPLAGGIALFEMVDMMPSPGRRGAATDDRSDQSKGADALNQIFHYSFPPNGEVVPHALSRYRLRAAISSSHPGTMHCRRASIADAGGRKSLERLRIPVDEAVGGVVDIGG
jgi:hypothetical protein